MCCGTPRKGVPKRGPTRSGLRPAQLSLDLFWIKDKSLTDTDSLPAPDVIATEIADDLEAALEQFTKIAARLATRA